MIAVIGSFRLPPDLIETALPRMQAVITASLQEPGCHAYSYAHDVADPGLFRVTEIWDSTGALDAHFDTDHMRLWAVERLAFDFSDRRISRYEIGEPEDI